MTTRLKKILFRSTAVLVFIVVVLAAFGIGVLTERTTGQSPVVFTQETLATKPTYETPSTVTVTAFGDIGWPDIRQALIDRDAEFIERWGIEPMTAETSHLPHGKEGNHPGILSAGLDTDYFRLFCRTNGLQGGYETELEKLCTGDITGKDGKQWSVALVRACYDGSVEACNRQTLRFYESSAEDVWELTQEEALARYPLADEADLTECVKNRELNACTAVLQDNGELRTAMLRPLSDQPQSE